MPSLEAGMLSLKDATEILTHSFAELESEFEEFTRVYMEDAANETGIPVGRFRERVEQHYCDSRSHIFDSIDFIRDTYLYLIPRIGGIDAEDTDSDT